MERKLILSTMALCMLTSAPAHAAHVDVGIGVGVPVVEPAYVAPPVYMAPAPVYVAPPAVYVSPYPGYYDPYHRRHDFGYWHDRRWHDHR